MKATRAILALFLTLLFLETNVVMAEAPATNLIKIAPIKVVLSSPAEVLVQSNVSHSIMTNVIGTFCKKQYVLDAVVPLKQGKIWCKAETTNSYMHPFHEKSVSSDDLKQFGGKTLTELIGELGEPSIVEGGFDEYGTVVWQWRFCAEGKDGKLRANVVTIGSNKVYGDGDSVGKYKAQFILLSTST